MFVSFAVFVVAMHPIIHVVLMIVHSVSAVHVDSHGVSSGLPWSVDSTIPEVESYLKYMHTYTLMELEQNQSGYTAITALMRMHAWLI